ncbi:MAG: hypothetical protein A2W91_00300 [Bacteroidetes bacterium GWF2_38_335]|nr:MAG: hypothetical protein A2W91_00300 [Bacteroidetes bacterium GWF2_38_335]OFY78274.1 MAG: hypothetical protein A2281_03680 [Bacteroidetes bacterium RIFOXYA12_FULL_38_20]HBS87532.1 hypothetical protein [Bacteroidales bacterium]
MLYPNPTSTTRLIKTVQPLKPACRQLGSAHYFFRISINSLLIYNVSRPTLYDFKTSMFSSSFRYLDAAFLSTFNLFVPCFLYMYQKKHFWYI